MGMKAADMVTFTISLGTKHELTDRRFKQGDVKAHRTDQIGQRHRVYMAIQGILQH